MLSVRDLLGNEEPFADFKELRRIRRVNGEQTLSLTVLPSEQNRHAFNLIKEESAIYFDSKFIIKKLNEKAVGQKSIKRIDAIHEFFVTLINKQQPKTHNGSITFNNYMNLVFEGTGYTFVVLDQFLARSFQNLGNDNRLSLLSKGIDRFKAEFELVGTEVRFQNQIGNDTDFQFRFGHNIKALDINVDTKNLATVIRGTGDPELGITAYYRSDNADIFGEIDAPPVDDERFKSEDALLEEMIARLQDEPEVSLTLDFIDLRAAGYPYTVPNEGDRVWVIYEPMNDLLVETRIMEIQEVLDVNLKPIRTEVTLSNLNYTFAEKMLNDTSKKLRDIVNDDGVVKYDVLDEAVRFATEALQSAQTELVFDNGIIAIDKIDPNKLVILNSAGIGISPDGGQTFNTAMTGDGIVADVITAGTIRGIDIIGTNIMSFNSVTNDVITLENGRIETFENGKKRFGVYGYGLTAFHWETEAEIAAFRATHINNQRYGAGIIGFGDYFTLGKRIDGLTSTPNLSINWDSAYDRTTLNGGIGDRGTGGDLTLRSVHQDYSAAGSDVPHIKVENITSGGTEWDRVAIFTGRRTKSPSASNYRAGFEVWQHTGNSDGSAQLMFDLDTNSSGEKYANFGVDLLYVSGDISTPNEIFATKDITTWGQFVGWGSGINSGLRFPGDSVISVRPEGTADYQMVVYPNRAGGGEIFEVRSHVNRSDYRGDLVIRSNGSLFNPQTFHNETTNAANIRMGTSSSSFFRSTSARRAKLLIEDYEDDPYKILQLRPRTWFDKGNYERYAEYLTKKENGEAVEPLDVEILRRTSGVVAEEIEEIGLEQFVDYDENGRIVTVQYERMWLPLVPVVSDHQEQIEKIWQEINKLKGVS